MDINNDVLIKKVQDIMNVLCLNSNSFSKRVGVDPANLRRKMSKKFNFTSNDIAKMAKAFDLPTVWFLEEDAVSFQDINNERTLKKLKSINQVGSSTPFFDVCFSDVINKEDIKEATFINIPWCDDVDFWVRANGDAMSPKIENGDIIGLRKIRDWEKFLPVGDIYAITASNGLRTIRIIDKCDNEDFYTLRATKDGFPSQELSKEDIKELYKVSGVLKIL